MSGTHETVSPWTADTGATCPHQCLPAAAETTDARSGVDNAQQSRHHTTTRTDRA